MHLSSVNMIRSSAFLPLKALFGFRRPPGPRGVRGPGVWWVFAVGWLLLVPGVADAGARSFELAPGLGGLTLKLRGFEPSPRPVDQDEASPAGADLVGVPASPATPRRGRPYASQGSVAWWFETGPGTNFDGGWLVLGGVGVEWYPIDGFAVGFRVDGVGIELEDTPTTGGGGGALLLRWHVHRAEDWSIYLDGGCGLVYFAEDVPSGASRLDFSPQVGGGVTCALGPEVRLMAGLRWYHLSNAQTNSSNPGVDMLQGYLGITFGF